MSGTKAPGYGRAGQGARGCLKCPPLFHGPKGKDQQQRPRKTEQASLGGRLERFARVWGDLSNGNLQEDAQGSGVGGVEL